VCWLHGRGTGIVVRTDGPGDRVVVGADQDSPGGEGGTPSDLHADVGDLEAVIAIGLQMRLDPDPLVESQDIVRRLSEVSRNPDAALADADRERLESVPPFRRRITSPLANTQGSCSACIRRVNEPTVWAISDPDAARAPVCGFYESIL
jgi:hypothetical protein